MKEIEELKQLVKSLAENLSAAKNQVLALKANQAESPDQPGNATKLSAGDTPETVANMEIVPPLQLLQTPLCQIRFSLP